MGSNNHTKPLSVSVGGGLNLNLCNCSQRTEPASYNPDKPRPFDTSEKEKNPGVWFKERIICGVKAIKKATWIRPLENRKLYQQEKEGNTIQLIMVCRNKSPPPTPYAPAHPRKKPSPPPAPTYPHDPHVFADSLCYATPPNQNPIHMQSKKNTQLQKCLVKVQKEKRKKVSSKSCHDQPRSRPIRYDMSTGVLQMFRHLQQRKRTEQAPPATSNICHN